MSSSIPISSSLDIRDIRFRDRTRLYSASDFNTDLRFRKKLRVDDDALFRKDIVVNGNITVNGAISTGEGETPTEYVDRQTGWGLDQWTFAGATYDQLTDSLIIKITNIEASYATVSYVDAKFQSANGRYLVPHDPNTVTKLADASETYPFACTTLSANTSFMIRDGTSFTNDFKFQKGSIQIGFVLKCLDAEGTVGWGPENSTSYTAETITTPYGATNSQFSLKVVDNSTSNGVFVFPRIASNSLNKAIAADSMCLLYGTGSLPTNQKRAFLGPYSYGTEGVSFIPSTTSGDQNGATIISGGSTTMDQIISLNTNGIFIAPKYNEGVNVILPSVIKSTLLNNWTKPFSIYGKLQKNDEYPTFIVTKENANAEKRSIMINPRMNGGNFNPLVSAGNIGIVFADTTQWDSNGSSSSFPEEDIILTITPWSNYGDGIAIRNSLAAEETSNDPHNSGYTRITGASSVTENSDLIRTPAHYIEVNRQGVIFKNSSSSETRNYGKFKVLTKHSALLNNPESDTQAGEFQVGEYNYTCNSILFGNLSCYGDIFYHKNPQLGYLLMCTDASSGKAEWRTLPPVTVPSEIVITSVECDFLKANKTFNIGNGFSTQLLLDEATATILPEFFAETDIYTSTNPPTLIDSLTAETFLRNTYYTFNGRAAEKICTLTVPTGNISLYTLDIPISIEHSWNFYNNYQGGNERENFWYDYLGLDYIVFESGNLYSQGTTVGDRIQQCVAVGYQRSPIGPNGRNQILSHSVYLSTTRLSLAFPNHHSTKTYEIYVKPYFRFYFSGEYICNFSIVYLFNPFRIIYNKPYTPLSGQLWSKQVIADDQTNQTSTYGQYWDQVRWESQIGAINQTEPYPGYVGVTSVPHWVPGFYSDNTTLSPYQTTSFSREKFMFADQIYTRNLLVKSDLFITNGYLTSQGTRCRKGSGSQSFESMNSTKGDQHGSYAWRQNKFIYNMDYSTSPWDKGLRIYINETVVQEFSSNTCDYRLKENFNEPPTILDRLDDLHIYQYDRKENGVLPKSYQHIGVIAHELQECFPDIPHLVHHEKDGEHFQSINHHELSMFLLQTMKEMKHELDLLRQEVYSLKSTLSTSL